MAEVMVKWSCVGAVGEMIDRQEVERVIKLPTGTLSNGKLGWKSTGLSQLSRRLVVGCGAYCSLTPDPVKPAGGAIYEYGHTPTPELQYSTSVLRTPAVLL
jgi:hypothetical protein